jgi:hypothetical protein
MPGQFSDAGSNKALDAVTGRATVSSATTYLALLTAAPGDTTTLSGLAEYGATGYSRQAVTWASPTLNGSNVPETSNTGTVSFGPFTASATGTITHAALVTAASGTTGSVLAWWELDASRTPSTNDSVEITTGNLKLSVD